MAEEFVINSNAIETKINQLLPSQGGFQPGVDFSASTMVVPIVDLTETAEGSNVRQDLQTSFAFSNITSFELTATGTTTIANVPGYYKILVNFQLGTSQQGRLELTDGVSTKVVVRYAGQSGGQDNITIEPIVFLRAGESCQVVNSASPTVISGCIRQIADVDGNLVDP